MSLADLINLEHFHLESNQIWRLETEHAGDRREGMNQAVMQQVYIETIWFQTDLILYF